MFGGCISEKKRRGICAGCPVVTHTKDSIVYKHDTVTVNIPGKPGPTVYLENPCKLLCDSLGNLKPVNITTRRNGTILNINTLGNGLNIVTETKDTTAKAPVLTKETFSQKEEAHIKWMPCTNERTDFDGFCRWFFYIMAPLVILWAVLKYWLRVPFL